jgi:hypothetical protein
VAIQGETVRRDYPFPAWSLTLPEPLPFPREPFEEALAVHLEMFEAHKDEVLAALQETSMAEEDQIPVSDLTAVIEAHKGKPDSVMVGSRGEAAAYLVRYRGLLRALLDRPVGHCTFVAIDAKGVLSLHLAEVTGFETQRFELVMVQRDVAFEPLSLKHRESGRFVVTEWRHKDGERRYAWARIPVEPATDDEAIDRVLVRDGPRMRQAMTDFASKHPGKRPLALVMCTREHGDAMEVMDRDRFSGMGARFPAIGRAVERTTRDAGLLPVVVHLGLSAGLRWLQIDKGDRALPPSLLEQATLPADEHAKPFFRPAEPEPEPEPEKPRRPLSPAEVIQYIRESGVQDEIDVHLVQMTREEIDRDITTAGFDPAIEHRTPWLPRKVVEALSKLERDESRFYNEQGNLRTR